MEILMKKIRLIAMVAFLVLSIGLLASCVPEVKITLDEVIDISDDNSGDEDVSQGPPPPVDKEGHAKAPVVTEVINITADRICVAGTCEKGATVKIHGGKEDVEVYSDNGYFIVETVLANYGTKLLEAVASKDGLKDSDSLYFYAQFKATVSERVDGNSVMIGKDSQLFLNSTLPDFYGENLYTNTQLNALKEKVNANYQAMQDAKLKMLERTKEEELVKEYGRALTPEELETIVKPWAQENFVAIPYIFVIAPNALTVYPERAPESVVSKSNTTRYKQVIKALKDTKATVIDLSEVFAAHKNDKYPIYSSTDSYWTEYGAYLAYVEIMNIVDDLYPDAAARPLSDFKIEEKEYIGGNMVGYLYIDRESVKETGIKLTPKFSIPFKTNIYASEDSLDIATEPNADKVVAPTTRRIINTKKENLPNGYILRDEWSSQMFSLLADRFSATIFHTAGSYDPRVVDINYSDETCRPDYAIVIFNESNIENVFKLNVE